MFQPSEIPGVLGMIRGFWGGSSGLREGGARRKASEDELLLCIKGDRAVLMLSSCAGVTHAVPILWDSQGKPDRLWAVIAPAQELGAPSARSVCVPRALLQHLLEMEPLEQPWQGFTSLRK